MIKEKFLEVEKILLEEVKKFYGTRLVSLVIFGSAGRGTPTPSSDLDFLIVVKNLVNGRIKRMKEFNRIERKIESKIKIFQKDGVYISLSPIIKTPEEVEKGSPLFLDMVEDAKIIFDRDDFFKNYIEKLKKHLKKLGAKRIWKGNLWYWDLKPDYKPGDIFEI